jgi:hypothetical protein
MCFLVFASVYKHAIDLYQETIVTTATKNNNGMYNIACGKINGISKLDQD